MAIGNRYKYLPHYTYDDWIRWEGRWELIEGIPVAMSPMPIPEHQRVSGELVTELNIAVRKSGSECADCKVYQPIDYKISEDTILEPDILVICGKLNRSYLDFPPSLIVEVLSTSTEEKDRGVKYHYYEHEGVKYYLMVDVNKKNVEVYKLVSGRYELYVPENNFEFQLSDVCTIWPHLDNIWE